MGEVDLRYNHGWGDFDTGGFEVGILSCNRVDGKSGSGSKGGVGYNSGKDLPEAVDWKEQVLWVESFLLGQYSKLSSDSGNDDLLAEICSLPILFQILVDVDDRGGIDIDILWWVTGSSIVFDDSVECRGTDFHLGGCRPIHMS